MTSAIETRLARIHADLVECASRNGRPPDDVQLVAVSKRQSAAAIRCAYDAGQRVFGENYLQEALAKQAELADCAIEWHFIGVVQGNKTADIARAFTWVHTVDRWRIAERLNAQRPADLPPLNVCLQVNISGEQSKSGVAPASLVELAAKISVLPRLRLRGLMALPAPSADVAEQRAAFAAVATLARRIALPLDTLSMGTSEDYAAAIAEGATMVRIGTAVFGPRPDRA